MEMGKKNKQKAMWERMEELVRKNKDYEQFCEYVFLYLNHALGKSDRVPAMLEKDMPDCCHEIPYLFIPSESTWKGSHVISSRVSFIVLHALPFG